MVGEFGSLGTAHERRTARVTRKETRSVEAIGVPGLTVADLHGLIEGLSDDARVSVYLSKGDRPGEQDLVRLTVTSEDR